MANNSSNQNAQSTPTTIVLQEKWNVFFKKHPILSFLLLLIGIAPLILKAIGQWNGNVYSYFVVPLIFWGIPLLRIVPKMINSREFKITIDGDKLIIDRNGEQVVNTTRSQITDLKFVKQQNQFRSFILKYTDKTAKTKSFYFSLEFIPSNECSEFFTQTKHYYL